MNQIKQFVHSSNINKQYGPKQQTMLNLASKGSYDDVADILRSNDIDVNRNDIRALINQYYASPTSCNHFIKYLIDLGADPNIPDTGNNYPIHYLVQANNYDMVKHVIQCGANINDHGSKGYTPLHMAVEANNIHIVRVLLDNGADTETRNNIGETAEFMANYRYGYHDIAGAIHDFQPVPTKGVHCCL